MNMTLHPLTLKFSGESAKFEAPFLRNYYQVSLPQLRRFLVLGALLYGCFGFLDALVMPEQKYTMWFIRFIIVGPVLLGTFGMSCSRLFERYMQPVMTCVLILAGGGIICMIAIAPVPVNYYYYAGVMLVLMWGYSFVCILFLWASFAGWVQVILYEIVAVWITPMPYDVLVSNSFFFISANILGMLACYFIEFYARRDFFLKQQLQFEREKTNQVNQELEMERENVTKMNQELEFRVKKRTEDYRIVNQELAREIAGHRHAEAALRESEERYRALVENANDIVFKTDEKGFLSFVNISTIRIIGYEEDEIIGKHYAEFVHPDMRKEAIEFFAHQLAKGIRNTYSELRIVTKDGQELWLGQNTQLILENGKIAGFQAVSRNITERKRLEKELKESEERYRELSIVDDLTQLYNSRCFYNQLQMEIDRIERHDYPLALLLLDIDDFKIFNDTYGHIAGDRVLVLLGRIIQGCLRKEDSAYRYGGEEFTIMLPMTTKEEGIVTAERIREELKQVHFSPKPGQDVYLTVSIGLAQYNKNEDIKAFVNRVDHLMYRGKRSGKNRVCCE
ncbi:MAG: diguanylate cyclase [Smithella sp.]|jgi:diguanylate cyclase (GGDEF)-like protein/PAS domain S-box-containing protein